MLKSMHAREGKAEYNGFFSLFKREQNKNKVISCFFPILHKIVEKKKEKKEAKMQRNKMMILMYFNIKKCKELNNRKTHLEEVTVWLLRAFRLILGLLFTAGSSPSFTAGEEAGGGVDKHV